MEQSKNILIIEDDEAIRETFRIAMEWQGYTVFTASNGKEGINTLLKMERPIMILLDLMMPIMDGRGFIEELEKLGGLANIPIILITAFPNQAKNIRVERIVKKPLDIEELYKTIQDLSKSGTHG